jgi:hypothetical protein
MGIFKSSSETYRADLDKEQLYSQVVDELANGQVRQGLYAQAIADSSGDKDKTEARYIQLRVELLRSERAALAESVKAQEIAAAKVMSQQRENALANTKQQILIETEERRQQELAEYKAIINQPVWPPKFKSYSYPIVWMAGGAFVIGRELFSPPTQLSMIIGGGVLCCIGLWLSRYVQRKSE